MQTVRPITNHNSKTNPDFFFLSFKDVLLLATAYRGNDYISERLDSSLKGRKAGG